MSFDKIKSLWRSSSDSTKEQSILDMTQNFISNSFRRSTVPTAISTMQFDDYLASIPSIKRLKKKPKSSSNTTLKPQLLKRCFESVDKCYFNQKYEIDQLVFEKKAKYNMERQQKLQEQLDEVEVCLFNQMSSRFDQILSVLRTIQALDLLVQESQAKIKMIRQGNFEKVMKVSDKQIKLTYLIAKKKRLDYTLELALKLKQYRKFVSLSNNLEAPQTLQEFYSTIPHVKANIIILSKLKASKTAQHKIEDAQATLKRSFSDKVNERIFDYVKRDIPYQIDFWKKYVNSNKVLQQKEQDLSENKSTMLDQSTIMGGQEETVVIIPKKEDSIQISIIDYIKKGWEDGEYAAGKLKTDIDNFLKSKHSSFVLDFRNFCDETCKKFERNVENPSLTNLLKQISILFCVKVYNYFFDIHKSLLLKYFSTTRKILELIVEISKEALTIEQKQKLKTFAQGFANSGAFLVRLTLEKLVDIIDTKIIHEGIDIGQIKQMIGVMENAQSFVQKQISLVTSISVEPESFLSEFFTTLQNRFPVKLLQVAKKRKLMDYLNKMHKNALTVQLKQSLENQIWQPTDIPIFYYDSLHYLITGQSLNLRRNKHNLKNQQSTMMYQTSVLMDGREESFFQQPTKLVGNFRIIRNDIIINGHTYKVTQTLLLLLQMLEDYMTLAQNFPVLKNEVGIRINQIIRSYNVSSCQLIVHAGAVALQKIKNKNITSRHLALSSLCLSFVIYIMQCLQKRVEIMDYEKLKQSIEEHADIIVKKLNQILVYKANSSKVDINLKNTPSKGTESIVSNTKILLEILSDYYGKQILNRIFTKEVLTIYVDSISIIPINTRVQAEALKDDVAFFFGELKALQGLNNDFTERRLKAEDIVRKGFQDL